ERNHSLVRTQAYRGDDCCIKGHIRNFRFDDPPHLAIADHGPFPAVTLHDAEMVACTAPVPGEEELAPEPEDIGRVVPDNVFNFGKGEAVPVEFDPPGKFRSVHGYITRCDYSHSVPRHSH